LTPASIGLFQFWTPIRRKLEELEKHKRFFLATMAGPFFGILLELFFLQLIFHGRTPYYWKPVAGGIMVLVFSLVIL
jgi:hypothetical protein